MSRLGVYTQRQAGRAGRRASERARERAGLTQPRPARRWHNNPAHARDVATVARFLPRHREGPSRVGHPLGRSGVEALQSGDRFNMPPTHQSVRVLTGSWLGRIGGGGISEAAESSSFPWRSLDVEAQLTRPAHTLPWKRVQKSAAVGDTMPILDYRVGFG